MRWYMLLMAAWPLSVTAATQAHGDYRVTVLEDLLTGQAVATATTPSMTNSGRYGDRQVLTLRCKGEAPQILINWQGYLGDDARNVAYRVDQREIQRVRAQMDTEGTSTFLKPSVIQDLFPGSRLVAEMRDYRGTRHQAVFSLRGVTAAFKALEPHCTTTLAAAVAEEVERRKEIDEEITFLAEQQRAAFSGSERERLAFKIRAAKRSLLQSVSKPKREPISALLDAGRLDDARTLLPDSPFTTSNLAILRDARREIEALED